MVDEPNNGDDGDDSPKNGNGEDTTEEITIDLDDVYGPSAEEWIPPNR